MKILLNHPNNSCNLNEFFVTNSLKSKAFTLIEIMVVIGISVLLMGISIEMFSALTNKQVVEKNTEIIYSALQEARNRTIVGEDGSQFGVQFYSSSIILFKGTSYNPTNPTNFLININPRVEISSINLSGATTTIYFSKISGISSATGTVQLILKSNSAISETITIHKSGLSEVQ